MAITNVHLTGVGHFKGYLDCLCTEQFVVYLNCNCHKRALSRVAILYSQKLFRGKNKDVLSLQLRLLVTFSFKI